MYEPFNRQINKFEFSPTWSWLTDATHKFNEWKLFRFDKMEVNDFET